jgi:RNA polymerase-interacting CarD/CdnL/TRCF family regulator
LSGLSRIKTKKFSSKEVRSSFKENLLKLKIGDHVVHTAFGTGNVVEIEEKQFSNSEVAHLYYKVTRLKHTIWIRVEGQKTTRLRLVTSGSSLNHYRDVLKSQPATLNANSKQRQLELNSRLKEGTFQSLCEVLRDLTASKLIKPLGQADRATLQKTQASLCEEWALAAGISDIEAIKEVNALLLRPVQLT